LEIDWAVANLNFNRTPGNGLGRSISARPPSMITSRWRGATIRPLIRRARMKPL